MEQTKKELCDEGRHLLEWAQSVLSEKYSLTIQDFGASWRDGVAFNSLIHNLDPSLVDTEKIFKRTPRRNLESAFSVAERELGIARSLCPDDVDVDLPDQVAIMKYVAQFAEKDDVDPRVIAAIMALQPEAKQQQQKVQLPPTPPPSPPPPPPPPQPQLRQRAQQKKKRELVADSTEQDENTGVKDKESTSSFRNVSSFLLFAVVAVVLVVKIFDLV